MTMVKHLHSLLIKLKWLLSAPLRLARSFEDTNIDQSSFLVSLFLVAFDNAKLFPARWCLKKTCYLARWIHIPGITVLIVVASPSPSETAGECLRDFLEGPKKRSVIRLGNYVDVSSVPFSTLTVYPPPSGDTLCSCFNTCDLRSF